MIFEKICSGTVFSYQLFIVKTTANSKIVVEIHGTGSTDKWVKLIDYSYYIIFNQVWLKGMSFSDF